MWLNILASHEIAPLKMDSTTQTSFHKSYVLNYGWTGGISMYINKLTLQIDMHPCVSSHKTWLDTISLRYEYAWVDIFILSLKYHFFTI